MTADHIATIGGLLCFVAAGVMTHKAGEVAGYGARACIYAGLAVQFAIAAIVVLS